ncbi:MAG: response regulator [Treponema sp.]|jgi:putative two-component system response regulator|nr:response regulator [Treponema sp.]
MASAEKKKTILLVDDDEINLAIVEKMLEDTYEILVAKSGKETLDYLLKGIVPNLILLDIIMPNMDGWEVFNRIRAISCLEDVPIAFITSLQGEAEHAYKIGAADYITKPFGKENLLQRIESIIK